MPQCVRIIACMVMCWLACSMVQAATVTWTGAADTNWSNTGNWSTGTLPGSGDTAEFASGGTTVNVDSSYTIDSLLLDSTADMTFSNGTLTLMSGLTMTGSNNFTFASGITLGADQTWNQSGTGTLTMTGQIDESAINTAMTKTGTGTIIMGNATLYSPAWSGTTTIEAGVLDLNNYAALNSNNIGVASVVIASGAVLQYDVPNPYENQQGAIAISGDGTLRKTGPSAMAFGFGGDVDWELSSSALIDVEQGEIIGGNGDLDFWTNNFANLYLAPGTGFDGIEANVVLDALTGSGSFSGSYHGYGYTAETIGVGGGSGSFSGTISDNYGPLNLIKAGAGNQTLTGTLTYTGTTTITGGALMIDGNGTAAAGGLEVKSGGTLGGTGSLGGVVTVDSGASMSPGDASPGTFTIAAASTTALTLSSSSTTTMALGSSSDQIACTGAGSIVAIGGSLIITNSGGLASGTYQLITFTGTTTSGAFSSVTMPLGYKAVVSIDNVTTHAVLLTVTQSDSWNGSISTDWNDAGNWGLGTVPVSTQDVLIGNGIGTYNTTPSVTASGGTCQSITFATAASTITAGGGALTIGTGGIIASVSGSVIACPVILGASQTWNISSSSCEVDGAISGAYSLTTTGTGTLTLTGANTYSGGTAISQGTIAGGGYALGSGQVTVAAAGTLAVSGSTGLAGRYYNVSPSFPDYYTFATLQVHLASQTLALANTASTLNFAGDGSAFPPPYNSGATNFETIYTGMLNISTPGTYIFNTSSDDGSMLWIDGIQVVYNDFGQGLTTQAGEIPLTAGIHNVEVGYFQGGGSYGMIAQISGAGNSTMVDLSSANVTMTPDLMISSLTGSGAVVLTSGNLLVGLDGTRSTFSGAISGIGGVMKTGAGTLTLSGSNTYTGLSSIYSGSLQMGAANALPASGTVFDLGTLDLNGFTTTVGGITGTGIIDTIAGGTPTLTVGQGDVSSGFAGTIQNSAGTLSLVKTGAGTLGLETNNTFSGTTTISNGIINAGGTALSTGLVTVASPGSLAVAGPPGLTAAYYNISPTPADFDTQAALLASLSGQPVALTYTATDLDFGGDGSGFPQPYAIGANNFETLFTGSLLITTAGTYTFNTSSDDGSMLWVDGALVVSNNNLHAVVTETGSVTLAVGYHEIVIGYFQGGGGYGLIVQMSGVDNTIMADLTAAACPIHATTQDLTIGSLAGTGTVSLVSANLVVGVNGTSTTFSGTIADDGITPQGLTKAGVGTLTLSGTSTFSGATTVSAGQLLVTGDSSAAAGAVTVASGATLGGTGSIGGAVTVSSGGSLTPGAGSPGTLTLTSGGTALTLASGSTFNVAVGTSGDLIACTGSTSKVMIDGTLAVTDAGGITATTYQVITFTGTSSTGTFATVSMPTGYAGTPSIDNVTAHAVLLTVSGLQVVTNSGIIVAPGDSVTVENTSLLVTAGSEAHASITYTLATIPLHGALRTCSGGNPIAIASSGTFTQGDIDNNLISYEHGDLSAVSDSFQVTISDTTGQAIGTTTVAITVSGTGLANGMVAYWPMEQTSGSSVPDALGTYTGTISGTTGWTSGGNFPYALALDGNTAVTLPAGMADFTAGLTVSAWIYPTGLGAWGRIIEFGNGPYSDNIIFFQNGASTTLSSYVVQGTGPTSGQLDVPSILGSNVWQHVVWTLDASANATIYNNGVAAGSSTLVTPNNITRTNNFISGSSWAGGHFLGSMDEVRVYQRACSPGEVKLLSQQAAPVISGMSTTAGFVEFGSPVALSSTTASVAVADCLYFSGGSLSVTNSNGSAQASDALVIAIAGGISTSGSNVLYSGNVFATIDGTANGSAGANLLVHFSTVCATPTAVSALMNALTFSTSAHPPSPTTRALTVVVSDATFSSAPITLSMSVSAVPQITTRLTQDANGDGQIESILVTTDVSLNGNVTGISATVSGYAVTGYSAGPAANQFSILFTPGSSPDTGATPVVQITANTSLAASSGGQLLPIDGSGIAATDGALPVLMSSAWSDGGAAGVSAGDTLTLTFSEGVTTASLPISGLGLPVSGDTLSTTTCANQTSSTVSLTLAGTPHLTPGGIYDHTILAAGSPSGIYLTATGAAAITDAVGLNPATGAAVSAVDIGPTSTSITISWAGTSDPQTWPLGSIALDSTANTHGVLSLQVNNAGNCTVNLAISASTSGPSGAWSPASSAGANAFLMKADTSAASVATPSDPADYALTLTTSQQTLFSSVFSGTASAAFYLFFQAPTAIAAGSAVQQTIAITVNASLPP